MQNFVIQPALAEHVHRITGIELEAATLFPPECMPEHLRSDHMPIAMVAEAQREGRLWVALVGEGELAGFALLRLVAGLALLEEVDVLPAYARKGMGRALVTRAITYARTHGHEALYLTTFSHLPWNAPFYSSMGFVRQPDNNLPAAILAILLEERARGLSQRTAMRLDLTTVPPQDGQPA